MKSTLAILFILCALVACSKKSVPVAAMSPEQATWHTVCRKCHNLRKSDPKKLTAAKWPAMVDKMQNKKGGHQFTDEQKAQILVYLIANAKP
jgi:hypothetical protein